MWKKLHDLMQRVCDGMEIIIATIVAFVLILVMAFWMPGEINAIVKDATAENLMVFLEQIMHFVVAIEFIKLMCKPNTENVIEVLIFVMARHMIVGTNGVKDLFLSVAAIVLLILTKKIALMAIFWRKLAEARAKINVERDKLNLEKEKFELERMTTEWDKNSAEHDLSLDDSEESLDDADEQQDNAELDDADEQ